MADKTYQPKVYRKSGGNEQVIASGGKQTVESGGEVDVESGASFEFGGVQQNSGVNRIGGVAAPAAAGNSQGTATAITADNNFVTASDDTKGVVLPTAVAGMRIMIKTTVSAKTLEVYPATGAAINAIAANSAITMAALTSAVFVASSATQWYTVPLVPS